ncbi:hypothetical protein JB92DRAFT_2846615 [Gautieria morchelliformis]|nr:hypothetical protein JB92DRAFT_2846615 [Gautieria morchelliformis]
MSWWTMIQVRLIFYCGSVYFSVRFRNNCQVYGYYISHHRAKAFESLSGSVPVSLVASVCGQLTRDDLLSVHKILLSLLTMLMMKHFPTYKMKLSPDAIAHTIALHRWSIFCLNDGDG